MREREDKEKRRKEIMEIESKKFDFFKLTLDIYARI